jgi:hypothetical protein
LTEPRTHFHQAQDSFAPVHLLHLGNGWPRIRPDHSPPPSVRQEPTTRNLPVRTEEDIDRERAQKATRCCKTKSSATPKSCSIHRSERVWDKNQGILFLDAAKKAEQIEKLAHGLKSKIKQTY